MNIKRLYLVLTAIGIIVPIAGIIYGYYRFDGSVSAMALDIYHFFLDNPVGWIIFAMSVNTSLALTAFAIYEANFRRDYFLLWVIPLMMLLGAGAALPFYLYLRLPSRSY